MINTTDNISSHYNDMTSGMVPTMSVQESMPNLLASFNAMPGAEPAADMSFDNANTFDA